MTPYNYIEEQDEPMTVVTKDGEEIEITIIVCDYTGSTEYRYKNGLDLETGEPINEGNEER
jgi:hypothetical protein